MATLRASALSPDGQRIAVGAMLSGNLSVFDTATGRSIAQHGSAHASPIAAMAFSGDGAKLATADAEGTIKIWADAQKLNSKSAALCDAQGPPRGDQHRRFFERWQAARHDQRRQNGQSLGSGKCRRGHPAIGRSPAVSFVARFSPDGQLIAAATVAGGVRLWDAATGRLVRELSAGDKGRVFSVAFSPTDNRLLAVGLRRTGRRFLCRAVGHRCRNGTGAVAGSDRSARPSGWTQSPGRSVRWRFRPMGSIWSPDSAQRAGCWQAGHSQSAEGLGGRHAPTDPPPEWTHGLLCFSRLLEGRNAAGQRQPRRDGDHLVDRRPGKRRRRSRIPIRNSIFHRGRGMVEDVAFSPDGKTLAMASREGNVQLWDVATGKLLETLKGHSSAVDAVVFSPDGRTLASGSNDQTVRLWNVETRRELMQLDPGSVELGSGVITCVFPRRQALVGRSDAAPPSGPPRRSSGTIPTGPPKNCDCSAAIERRLPEPHPDVVREPEAARSAGKARRERCACASRPGRHAGQLACLAPGVAGGRRGV